MCQETGDKNAEKDDKGPALEDTSNVGPASNVGDENHKHV